MKAGYKYTLLLATLFYFATLIQAQNQSFSFNYLSTLDGLSNNSVKAILEDSHGFLWVATTDGLNRYDGYEFITFKNDIDNPNSLTNNYILCLAEDKSGNIWIGTNQSGLVRYNTINEKFYRYHHLPSDFSTIPGTVIRKITVDNNNSVWVGTDNGLAKYDAENDNFKRFGFPINGATIEWQTDSKDIFQTADNELIVQCNLGLFKINLSNDNLYKLEYSISQIDEGILSGNFPLLFDKANNIWIGSTGGLIKYNLLANTYVKYTNQANNERSVSSHNFSTIFQDGKGNIWIGTSDNGVNLYNAKTDDFTVLKAANYKGKSLSSNIINHIFEDSRQNLWFSTQEGGISYINSANNHFEYFSHNPVDSRSISNNVVNSFFENAGGTIWVGTGDGVLNKLVNNKEFEKFSLKSESIAPSILGITGNGKNNLLVTGWNLGLYEFNIVSHTYKNLMHGQLINGKALAKNIKGLGTDTKGNVWLATHHENGLMVYSPTYNQFYNENKPGDFNADLMKVPYAVDMLQDSKNRIWIVSYTGLFMFDTILHDFKNVPENIETLSSDYIYTIFEDRDSVLWVGNSNGLDKVVETKQGISFERISYNYAIPTNIKGILQDNNGNLWLSSNSELTQFHPETKKILHFKINKELPSQEFSERSCLKASNGEMYFGGTSGFFRFAPDSIAYKKANNKVYLTNFMLFNKSQSVNTPNSPLKKSILETNEIKLTYNQSVISFEYVALNFNPYKTIEYAYKMEGFDKDWYYVGDKRSVTYTNLHHGEYTFKVKLVEGNEISENEGTELKIIISPPFYKTLAAYFAYVILIFLLLYGFRRSIIYREKLRNELKMEKLNLKNVHEANLMKLRFFTNISHEFRTPLTLIKAPLEKLLQSDGEVSPQDNTYHLGLINKNTDRLLKMVNQLMDYRKLEAGSLVLEPSHGDIVEFCKNTWSAFGFLAEQKNIKYTFSSQLETLTMSFDPDKLDKVVSNLLSNAFKHTQKYGQISVTLTFLSKTEKTFEFLNISVKDTGVGISAKDLPHIFERFYSVSQKKAGKIEGTGIGLTLAKELTELHKGSIQVNSVQGEGTEFSVQIPLMNHPLTQPNIETKDVENDDVLIQKSVGKKYDVIIDAGEKIKKPLILLVEDDDELREFIKNELAIHYRIILAKNGEEALRITSFEVPDLVLSDVMMPKMDGFELCKTLKSDERTSHLPIILLTARHSHQKQLEGFDAGADDYMFKPFSVALLKTRIHNLLTTRREIVEKFKKGTSLYFDTEGVENKDNQFIQAIIDLVLENITDENINADFIAQKMLVSRSLVYLKIEALAGQTVNEFVRNIRLKKSLRLLEQNNLTITEIAYAVGFSSQSYYTRSFTKLYGVSPKEYISKNAKN